MNRDRNFKPSFLKTHFNIATKHVWL
jgi:hypothetical protein